MGHRPQVLEDEPVPFVPEAPVPLREDRFGTWAAEVITELRGENEPVPMPEEEPIVEVGSDGDDGVFDVGLHEEIAHEHSRTVARMVEDLAAQPGLVSARPRLGPASSRPAGKTAGCCW